jgi:hypothetical protein
MEEIRDLKDIKYGLIAIDPQTLNKETGTVDITHFVGYWNEPTKQDAESLLEELKNDKEFGLTEIADRLQIIEAPEEIVDYYIGESIKGTMQGTKNE